MTMISRAERTLVSDWWWTIDRVTLAPGPMRAGGRSSLRV